MNLVALYLRKEERGKKYAPNLTIFNSDRKVIDILCHISESCTYFKRLSYFKRYCTFNTSKLFQIFPKNLIVNFGGQIWLIPYIVL